MRNEFLIDGNIDWKLLREQKQTLSKIVDPFYDPKPRNAHHLYGILHLIDDIQDKAVESGKWTEKEIFG